MKVFCVYHWTDQISKYIVKENKNYVMGDGDEEPCDVGLENIY